MSIHVKSRYHLLINDLIDKNILDKSLKNDSTFRQAFLDGAFTVPGDGCIDYKPFLTVLKNRNYEGWLVVEAEQDPAKANPFEYAKIGYDYLSKTAKAVSYTHLTLPTNREV